MVLSLVLVFPWQRMRPVPTQMTSPLTPALCPLHPLYPPIFRGESFVKMIYWR